MSLQSRSDADPAWVAEHRQHVLQLVRHLIATIEELQNDDEQALDAVVEQRWALAQAAAEVMPHLPRFSPIWASYDRLSRYGGLEAEAWQLAYREYHLHGIALPDLERVAHELEHPAEVPSRLRENSEDYLIDWLRQSVDHLEAYLYPLRQAMAGLREHPHDEPARAAVRDAWAAMVQATRDILAHLEHARSGDGRHELHVSWLEFAITGFEAAVHYATGPQLAPAVALDDHQDVAASIHQLEEALARISHTLYGSLTS